MKDYTYTRASLNPDAFAWLTNMGLRETQWILDAKWLYLIHNMSYKNWIS